MSPFFLVIGCVGPLSLVYALWIVARLSARLGHELGKPKTFRWLYVAIGLIGAGLIIRLLTIVFPSLDVDAGNILYNLSLALGLGLAALVVWRYWGWLLRERSAR